MRTFKTTYRFLGLILLTVLSMSQAQAEVDWESLPPTIAFSGDPFPYITQPEPVPEPETILLLTAGVLPLLARKRNRHRC